MSQSFMINSSPARLDDTIGEQSKPTVKRYTDIFMLVEPNTLIWTVTTLPVVLLLTNNGWLIYVAIAPNELRISKGSRAERSRGTSRKCPCSSAKENQFRWSEYNFTAMQPINSRQECNKIIPWALHVLASFSLSLVRAKVVVGIWTWWRTDSPRALVFAKFNIPALARCARAQIDKRSTPESA